MNGKDECFHCDFEFSQTSTSASIITACMKCFWGNEQQWSIQNKIVIGLWCCSHHRVLGIWLISRLIQPISTLFLQRLTKTSPIILLCLMPEQDYFTMSNARWFYSSRDTASRRERVKSVALYCIPETPAINSTCKNNIALIWREIQSWIVNFFQAWTPVKHMFITNNLGLILVLGCLLKNIGWE